MTRPDGRDHQRDPEARDNSQNADNGGHGQRRANAGIGIVMHEFEVEIGARAGARGQPLTGFEHRFLCCTLAVMSGACADTGVVDRHGRLTHLLDTANKNALATLSIRP